MKNRKLENLSHYLSIGNTFILVLLGLMSITTPPENKIVFLNPNEKVEEKEVKGELCKGAWKTFQLNKLSDRLFHPTIKSHIENSKKVELSRKGIVKVFTKMTSENVCKVIIQRKDGFTGVNSIFSNEGDFGYQITSLLIMDKLTINDVRSLL